MTKKRKMQTKGDRRREREATRSKSPARTKKGNIPKGDPTKVWFVRFGGSDLGPYDVEEVREGLEQALFLEDSVAIHRHSFKRQSVEKLLREADELAEKIALGEITEEESIAEEIDSEYDGLEDLPEFDDNGDREWPRASSSGSRSSSSDGGVNGGRTIPEDERWHRSGGRTGANSHSSPGGSRSRSSFGGGRQGGYSTRRSDMSTDPVDPWSSMTPPGVNQGRSGGKKSGPPRQTSLFGFPASQPARGRQPSTPRAADATQSPFRQTQAAASMYDRVQNGEISWSEYIEARRYEEEGLAEHLEEFPLSLRERDLRLSEESGLNDALQDIDESARLVMGVIHRISLNRRRRLTEELDKERKAYLREYHDERDWNEYFSPEWDGLYGICSVPGPIGERIETGPVRFGDDWPGVFFRGDDAMALGVDVSTVCTALENLPAEHNTAEVQLAVRSLMGMVSIVEDHVAIPATEKVSRVPGTPPVADPVTDTVDLAVDTDSTSTTISAEDAHVGGKPHKTGSSGKV